LKLFFPKLDQTDQRGKIITTKKFYRFVTCEHTFLWNGLSNRKTNGVKYLQILSILLVFTIACKKSDNNDPIKSGLIGKWTYTESYISPAGPTDWQPVSPPGQTIEFKHDGTFIPCESFHKDADHFEVLDSVNVRIQPAPGGGQMRYTIDSTGHQLVMSPTNPGCIEACIYKFER